MLWMHRHLMRGAARIDAGGLGINYIQIRARRLQPPCQLLLCFRFIFPVAIFAPSSENERGSARLRLFKNLSNGVVPSSLDDSRNKHSIEDKPRSLARQLGIKR